MTPPVKRLLNPSPSPWARASTACSTTFSYDSEDGPAGVGDASAIDRHGERQTIARISKIFFTLVSVADHYVARKGPSR